MPPKRTLKIEARKSRSGWNVKVIAQSLRGHNFADAEDESGGSTFTANDGFMLTSDDQPEMRAHEHRLFVRGARPSLDESTVNILDDDFVRVAQAIKEYNNGKAAGDYIRFK